MEILKIKNLNLKIREKEILKNVFLSYSTLLKMKFLFFYFLKNVC